MRINDTWVQRENKGKTKSKNVNLMIFGNGDAVAHAAEEILFMIHVKYI